MSSPHSHLVRSLSAKGKTRKQICVETGLSKHIVDHVLYREQPPKPKDTPWSETAIERLRELWDSGMPTQAIGDALGISKNSVISKAHRLQLAPRQSPIHRDPNAPRKPKPAPKVGSRPTLPRLPSVQKVVEMPRAPKPMPLFDRPEFRERAVDMGERAPVGLVVVPKISAHGKCQFPQWTDATPRSARRFCGAPALFGKSWCERCYSVVFKRLPVAEAA